MSSIVLTGGGTAGHCIPNLALLADLKKVFDNIYYIGSENGIEKKLATDAGLRYFGVTSCKFARSFSPKNFAIPYKLFKGVSEAKKILNELQPSVVFSKGGYAALPAAMAAHQLGIPLILHESDLSVGLANKMASGKADKVLTTFKPTAATVKHGIFVGSPLRNELFNGDKATAKREFGLGDVKPVVLFIGGSQGSKALNNALKDSLDKLMPVFDILHITGKGNAPLTSGNGYKAFEFNTDMASVYAAADIAVSRCGSNAACELILLKKPTVFIPLPRGNSRGDQVENAEFFLRRGLCEMLEERNLTSDSLTTAIMSTYANRYNLKRNLESTADVKVGNEKIIEILSSYARIR